MGGCGGMAGKEGWVNGEREREGGRDRTRKWKPVVESRYSR